MHITLLAQNLEGKDGWSRYARDLSQALSSCGHTVTALVETKSGEVEWCKQITCLLSPLHCLSIPGIILQSWKLWCILRREKTDVIHVICEPYALPLAIIQKKWSVIITIHGSYAVVPFKFSRACRILTQRAFRLAAGIIAVSQFTKNFLKSHEPALFDSARLEEKVSVIHNAIVIGSNIRFIDRPMKGEAKYIIGVGAVKKRKGYVQVMHALASFKKSSGQPFCYDIIGSIDDQKYLAELQAVIVSLGLNEEVRIRGVLSDEELSDAYEHADLFLLLSLAEGTHVEGFVLAFLEAAARGVPCVGPATGGCPEAIDDGKTGYICDPYDCLAVSKAMTEILYKNVIDRKVCRRWAEEHDIQRMIQGIESLYESAQSSH